MTHSIVPPYLHTLSISIPFPVGPDITDHRALIGERLAFHEARARRILEVEGDDILTAHEIAAVLFPNLDPVNYFLAISEVIGHLQWLEVEGRMAHIEQENVARWRV